MTTTLRPLGAPEPADPGAASRSQHFAIRANGRQVGSVRLGRSGGQGWLTDLEVAPERRRRGHGSVAVLAAEEVLRDWGCREVRAHVPASAPAARALGEALGYTVDCQVMVKRLGWRRPRLPAGLHARELRADEYDAWLAGETEAYAEALIVHELVPRAEADRRAAEAYASVLPEGLDTAGMAVRALEVAGERVGTVLLAFASRNAPGRAWVYHVLVEPGHRRAGYGRALMQVAELECRAAGVRELGLNVFLDNPVAVRLYASLGYRVETWVLRKGL